MARKEDQSKPIRHVLHRGKIVPFGSIPEKKNAAGAGDAGEAGETAGFAADEANLQNAAGAGDAGEAAGAGDAGEAAGAGDAGEAAGAGNAGEAAGAVGSQPAVVAETPQATPPGSQSFQARRGRRGR